MVYAPTTGSTNDDAKRLAASGEPEGTVLLADEQTAGRGRAGKARWVTPARTSIAASVILRPHLNPAQLGALAMLGGLTVVDAVHRACGVVSALKWPNDVIVGGRKMGGVLIESSLAGGGLDYAVVGFGLNGNLPAAGLGPLPDAALPATTLLEEVGRPVSREAFVVALLQALDDRYAALRAQRQAALLDDFRAALDTLGRPIRLTCPGEIVDGVAEDVTEDGALVVRLDGGARRTFAYGDVTVRPPPRPGDPPSGRS
ncbi:MAG TPA: biotin--[acetyl-CoA-carboxylase] ligase [Chloroflexota bacterium]|nr:biotin--[acetyl-CoA-carboxylase] ligase [Chloroflexota bacterium]